MLDRQVARVRRCAACTWPHMICEDRAPRAWHFAHRHHASGRPAAAARAGPRGCVLPRVELPDGWPPEVIGEVSRALTSALKREALGPALSAARRRARLRGRTVWIDRARCPSPFFWITGAMARHLGGPRYSAGRSAIAGRLVRDVAHAPDTARGVGASGLARARRALDRCADRRRSARRASAASLRSKAAGANQLGAARAHFRRRPLLQGWTWRRDRDPRADAEGERHRRAPAEVVAADREKGWLLLRDFGGRRAGCAVDA